MAFAAGPDAAIIEYRIDKGEWKKQDLLTNWSKHIHLPWYYTLATGLIEGAHKIELRVNKYQSEEKTEQACRIRYFYVNKESTLD